MAFNPSDYHPDWRSIVRQINEQAGNQCEFCGVPNGELVLRDRRYPETRWRVVHGLEAETAYLEGEWVTKVVLTTAHLCWNTCADTRCIDPTHLRALCQRCHLNYDRDHHIEVQRQNREAKRRQVQPVLLEMI